MSGNNHTPERMDSQAPNDSEFVAHATAEHPTAHSPDCEPGPSIECQHCDCMTDDLDCCLCDHDLDFCWQASWK